MGGEGLAQKSQQNFHFFNFDGTPYRSANAPIINSRKGIILQFEFMMSTEYCLNSKMPFKLNF